MNIWVRLNYPTTHRHPLPPSNSQSKSTTTLQKSKYIYDQPSLPTTSQNTPTTIHHPPSPPPSTNTHHHPPTAKINPPLPSTNQNIFTTSHHCSPQAKIYQSPSTTTHQQPKYIHHHAPQSKILIFLLIGYNHNLKNRKSWNIRPYHTGGLFNLNRWSRKTLVWILNNLTWLTALLNLNLNNLHCDYGLFIWIKNGMFI